MSNLVYHNESKARKPLEETRTVDVCIYGANSAGVIAAVVAAQKGLKVALLANGEHIGGLTSGGLGETDIGNKAVIGGMSRKFYQRLGAYYGKDEEWKFEPGAASRVFRDLMKEAGVVPVLNQFLDSVEVTGKRIHKLRCQSGLEIVAAYFLDTSYEGDLMAAAGVPYTVGRESNAKYGETLNGVQVREKHQFDFPVSPYCREGVASSGLLPYVLDEPIGQPGDGDDLVQAYNFRMCLTQAKDRIPFPRPEVYEPMHYELLARYLRDGWKDVFRKFDRIQGDKTDTNNHGAVSTDFIGANHRFPEASYSERERIFQEHVNYQQGLMWFYCNDDRCPAPFRAAMSSWGLAADEFLQTDHWPAQLYIREARRMVGDIVVTEHFIRGYQSSTRGVGMGAYTMDSHNCRRIRVGDRVLNDGDVQSAGFPPYVIPYEAIVPPSGSIENLFVPVCLSASHIAYGSIRMEPVFMILGESAARAAAQCLKAQCRVQDLDHAVLGAELREAGQIIDLPEMTPEERRKMEVKVV